MSTSPNAESAKGAASQLIDRPGFWMHIDRVTSDTADIRTCELSFTDPLTAETFSFRPGQFCRLHLPGGVDCAAWISGDSDWPQRLIVTLDLSGMDAASAGVLRAGERVQLSGPYGGGWPLEQLRGSRVIAVAGGLGLAPLRSALYALMSRPDDFSGLVLLHGARSREGLLFMQEYAPWARQGLSVQLIVDHSGPNWHGRVGSIPVLVDQLRLLDPRHTCLLCSGPRTLQQHAIDSVRRLGVPAENIWVLVHDSLDGASTQPGSATSDAASSGPVYRYDELPEGLLMGTA